ncbi:MAG TPA: site-2 protease family protein [candidate division Zixibacteria bacterium]|nr:site-2 protease family protein [candidate division Zixibacteria bacterium]
MKTIYIFLIIALTWFLVYILGRMLKLEEKYNWTITPLFILIRTKWFNNFLKKIAKKYARFWRLMGNISIFVGFISMFLAIGLLLFTLIDFFLPNPTVSSEGPAIGLIIPGVTISFKTFLYLIIPLILSVFPHEFAHGVVSHADGVELKSTGLAFFAIFFGAFVEPDEEDIMNSSAKTKMRTFASGMFPNVILGLITIPLFIFAPNIIAPFYLPPDGILIMEVVEESPAAIAGLERGFVIFDINSTHISTSAVFSEYMMKTQPNQTLQMNTSDGNYNAKLDASPANESIGYLGIYTIQYQEPKFGSVGKFFPYHFSQQLMWLLVVSFGSVLFNALPIPFLLDGDKLLSAFLSQYIRNQKVAYIILDVFRYLAIILFLANIILPILKYGIVPIG